MTWAGTNWVPLAHIILCTLVVASVAIKPGWPLGHDVQPLFERVEAFRREFAAGNLFPLWTPFAFDGHGAPMPLFYHRLFNSVAGLLALPLGTIAAVKLTINLFLVVGAFGMAAAADELGCGPWIRWWSGAMLALAHYTFLDWLVRGAGAELAASMLLPWLIQVCLRMQGDQPFGLRLGAVLALLFYAHAALFLYTLVLLPIALACRLADPRETWGATFSYLGRGLAIALGIVIACVGPPVAAIAVIGREFNLDRLSVYLPQHEFRRTRNYFIDDFPWGRVWEGFSVEIGRFLVAALALAMALVLISRSRLQVRPFVFMAASAAAYFGLQLPLAGFLYRSLPFAQILQFPWRLLAFITPLVILMVAALGRALHEARGRWGYAATAILAGAWTAQVSFAMTASAIKYPRISRADLLTEIARLDGPFGVGEFLPRKLADRLAPPPHVPLLQIEGCQVVHSSADAKTLERVPFQTLDLVFHSDGGCKVHFSQFWTSLIAVEPSSGGSLLRTPDETVDVVLPPGLSGVHIERRGLFRALAYAIDHPELRHPELRPR